MIEEYLGIALPIAALLVAAMPLIVVCLRLSRRRALRKRTALLAPVRGLLLTAASGDDLTEDQSAALLALPERTWAHVELDVVALIDKIRGDGRAALVGLLERRGSVGQAFAGLSSRRGHRRAAAARLIGLAGRAGSAPTLLPLLADRDAYVRLTVARALGQLADPVAAGPLLRLLGTPGAASTVVVSQALLNIGLPAQGALREALADPDDLTRAVAVEVLGLLGAPSAAADIGQLLETDPTGDVRARAARALGRIGMPSSSIALQRACTRDDLELVRLAAVHALGDVGDRAAVAPLARLVSGSSSAVAAGAAEALLRLAPEGALALRDITTAPDSPDSGRAIATATLHRAELRAGGRILTATTAAGAADGDALAGYTSDGSVSQNIPAQGAVA